MAEVQREADRLALALEDVGFDVGREFPMLLGRVGPHGVGVVHLGDVGAGTADRLSSVLRSAARQGVVAPDPAE
jgi:hypothetical protein